MAKNLNNKAWIQFVLFSIVNAILIFGAAGTLNFWQAWLFLIIFSIASILTMIYLMKHDPALLKRRLHAGPTAEKQTPQRIIMVFATVGFFILLIVPGLDRRFGWSNVPIWLVIVGDALVALGFYFVFLVYKVNTYTSATIEVAKNQKVVSTGPYAIVRHPMYAGSLVWILGMPLALASYWGLLVVAAMMFFLIWRLIEEEKYLAQHLTGYTKYQKKVKARLIPGIF